MALMVHLARWQRMADYEKILGAPVPLHLRFRCTKSAEMSGTTELSVFPDKKLNYLVFKVHPQHVCILGAQWPGSAYWLKSI